MHKEIYEAKAFYGVNPAFLILGIITFLIIVLVIVFWRRAEIDVRCLSLFIIAFLLFIIFCQVYTSIDAKCKVYDKYVAGEYLAVQGVISDYTPAEEGQPRLSDTFSIDGVQFSAPGYVSCWGYPLNHANGGILDNGVYVRICYVPYKFENVIMKIELLPEE